MTPLPIYKILRAQIANCLRDVLPDVRFACATDVEELTPPSVVVGVSLDAREPFGNASATVSLTWTLSTPSDETWTNERAETVFAQLCDSLNANLTRDVLNTYAEELGQKVFFYSMRWSATPVCESFDTLRVQTVEFTGVVQF